MSSATDRKVILTDTIDGYSPLDNVDPKYRQAEQPVAVRDGSGSWGIRSWLAKVLPSVVMDGYQNRLTGIGDPSRDKTFGGRFNGPDFVNQFLSGWEAQERWRGSDLGGRIVETIPREMTRRGWTIKIQPDTNDERRDEIRSKELLRMLRDVHGAGGIHTDKGKRLYAAYSAWRDDEFPVAESTTATSHKPGALPEASDDNTALIEALTDEQEKLGLGPAIYTGLCYERSYGGAGILIGVDDGETDLTKPLDWKKVKRITHLTPFRGGWDGELIAQRYYTNATDPKFGQVAVYQLRNLGVTLTTPAPGEDPRQVPQLGTLIFYVHESRLLIFPGDPVSNWARVQMRGWGDAVWMRVNQILAQYCQSWEGIAILMQELGVPVLSMDKFSEMMSALDGSGLNVVTNRAIAMSMSMSMAKIRIIDSKEKLERVTVQLAGVAEVLKEFALRLAAAADMPASLLMNQGKGGLGDTGKGDQDIFYDQVEGRQTRQVTPLVRQFVALQLAATEGVARGKSPNRWSVTMNPLRQMDSQAQAEYRFKIASTDEKMIDKGVVTPEEVASTRYGSSDFNDGPIVLDLEGRAAMQAP